MIRGCFDRIMSVVDGKEWIENLWNNAGRLGWVFQRIIVFFKWQFFERNLFHKIYLEMCDAADTKLFNTILLNKDRILRQPLLPPKAPNSSLAHFMGHHLTILQYQVGQNFIIRLLCKDVFFLNLKMKIMVQSYIRYFAAVIFTTRSAIFSLCSFSTMFEDNVYFCKLFVMVINLGNSI